MAAPRKYPDELRECATRLVQQHQSGERTIVDLAALFSVSRATVYRVLERAGHGSTGRSA